MEELEKMFELFPEKECPNINSAFRKLHANLMFRSERAAVSISGGADSDVMIDMIQALNPEKNYPFAEIHYVWFNTGIEYTATKEHLDFLQEKYGVTIERKKAKTPVPLGCKTWGQPFMSKQIRPSGRTLFRRWLDAGSKPPMHRRKPQRLFRAVCGGVAGSAGNGV